MHIPHNDYDLVMHYPATAFSLEWLRDNSLRLFACLLVDAMG